MSIAHSRCTQKTPFSIVNDSVVKHIHIISIKHVMVTMVIRYLDPWFMELYIQLELLLSSWPSEMQWQTTLCNHQLPCFSSGIFTCEHLLTHVQISVCLPSVIHTMSDLYLHAPPCGAIHHIYIAFPINFKSTTNSCHNQLQKLRSWYNDATNRADATNLLFLLKYCHFFWTCLMTVHLPSTTKIEELFSTSILQPAPHKQASTFPLICQISYTAWQAGKSLHFTPGYFIAPLHCTWTAVTYISI